MAQFESYSYRVLSADGGPCSAERQRRMVDSVRIQKLHQSTLKSCHVDVLGFWYVAHFHLHTCMTLVRAIGLYETCKECSCCWFKEFHV